MYVYIIYIHFPSSLPISCLVLKSMLISPTCRLTTKSGSRQVGSQEKKNNLNKLPQIQRQLKKSGLCRFYCGQMIIHQLQQNPYG